MPRVITDSRHAQPRYYSGVDRILWWLWDLTGAILIVGFFVIFWFDDLPG